MFLAFKMKPYILLVMCITAALAAANNRDDVCTVENCDRTNGCVCINIVSPLPKEETPQVSTTKQYT